MLYLMLSLFDDESETPRSLESVTGLTTPSIRFLLQSPRLISEEVLWYVTLPVRSMRSSRARALLRPPGWISFTGENLGIEINSSFEEGLKYNDHK